MAESQRYDLRRQTMIDIANVLTSLRRLRRSLIESPRHTTGEGQAYEQAAAAHIDFAILPMCDVRESLEALDTV